MNNSSIIDTIIDRSHFSDLNKIYKLVKQTIPDVSKKQIKHILDTRHKDRYMKDWQTKPYQVKIFSVAPNTYFHDILDNGANNNPRYYHIFIGTNNRYATAIPLETKSISSIIKSLQQFVNMNHPTKLTSDEEPAFKSAQVKKYLSDNSIDQHIVLDQIHSTLGIIDRFIRTLRDMNTPTTKSKRQSHDDKYKSFTEKRMAKLINIYNSTEHSSIKMTPGEMKNNVMYEMEYVDRMVSKQEEQQRIKDFIIKDKSIVRIILPKNNGITKKRYQVSNEYYTVEQRSGNIYTLMARDGTYIKKPRYQIILANTGNEAETIPGKWNGIIDEIISYDNKTNKYKVRFKTNDGSKYIDNIPASFIK